MKLRIEIEELDDVHPKIRKELYDFSYFVLDFDVINYISIETLIAYLNSKKQYFYLSMRHLAKKWYVSIYNKYDYIEISSYTEELFDALFDLVRKILRLEDEEFDRF